MGLQEQKSDNLYLRSCNYVFDGLLITGQLNIVAKYYQRLYLVSIYPQLQITKIAFNQNQKAQISVHDDSEFRYGVKNIDLQKHMYPDHQVLTMIYSQRNYAAIGVQVS